MNGAVLQYQPKVTHHEKCPFKVPVNVMTERVAEGFHTYLQKLLAKFLTVLLTAKFESKLGGNYCGCLHDGDTRSLLELQKKVREDFTIT